jgi:hypothetical protein
MILELRVGRSRPGHRLLGDHAQLLLHAPADHRVVAVEPHRQAFAIEHLVAHVRFDEALELGGRGGPLPRDLVLPDDGRPRWRR